MKRIILKTPVEIRCVVGIMVGIFIGIQIGLLTTILIQYEWNSWATIASIPTLPPGNVGAIGIVITVVMSLGCAITTAATAINLPNYD